jgi:gliding motility-associated-like protein
MQVGSDIDVKLYVSDGAGNVDSCSATVKVKSTTLMPTFESGLCATDTIKIFGNVPPAATQGTYTYKWTGPNGENFFVENPIIPSVDQSYNGQYKLEVTGFNGCISIGTVLVNVNPITNPTLTTSEATICEGEDIILSTTSYVGNITYNWYQGINPTGVLIGQSQVADFAVKPNLGTIFYYAIIDGKTCKSNPSNLLKVTVLKQPEAQVNDILLTPCEGQDIQLGSPITNTNFQYFWNGPGYVGTGRIPETIANASLANAGVYTLVIKNGQCISDTASTIVEILESPDQPIINASDIYCQGSTITLVALNATSASKYEWYKDGILYSTTTENNLNLFNAQLSYQGTWTVKAIQGQCSSPLSVSKFIAVDVLEFGVTNSGPACEGDSIQLLATFIPNATYKWDGPTAINSNIHDPTVLAVPGDYSVTLTTPTLCQNNATTTVRVISLPEITALSSDAKLCMDLGTDLNFSPSIFPNDPAFTFKWSGPGGFMSTLKNAVKDNITQQDTGIYTLIVLNQGCPSLPQKIDVDFKIIPPRPEIVAKDFYCSGDSIILTIANLTQTGSYLWNTPLGQVTTTQPILRLASQVGGGGKYSVGLTIDGCSSDMSDTITVQIRPRPSKPAVFGQSPICFGDTLNLTTSTPLSGNAFVWFKNGASVANTQTYIIPYATETSEASYTLQVIKDGCPSAISDPILITVKPEIGTPSFATANTSICANTIGLELCIQSQSAVPNAQVNFITNSGQILSSTSSLCQMITDISKLNLGPNFIYVRHEIDGCYSERSTPIIIDVKETPSQIATIIEGDITACPGEIVKLTALHDSPLVNIQWSALDNAVLIESPTSMTTLISNLKPGSNAVTLSYSIDGCSNFSSDTIDITLDFLPTALQDVYTIAYGSNGLFDILSNDVLPSEYLVTIVKQPQAGSAKIENNKLIYNADPRYISSQFVTYRVCSRFCDDLCAEATVIIDTDEDIPCKLPHVITPNEDGINDVLIIPCLGNGDYPQNRIMIFNEWGQEVFNDTDYKNDWDGSFNGVPLPVGTYFYILKLNDKVKTLHGFLVIQR